MISTTKVITFFTDNVFSWLFEMAKTPNFKLFDGFAVLSTALKVSTYALDANKIKTEPENRSLLIGLGPLRLALLGF